MTAAVAIAIAVKLSRALPRSDVQKLAQALLTKHGLSTLKSAAGQVVRDACTQLQGIGLDDTTRPLAAGALLASLEPDPAATSITVVWTGPETKSAIRLTSAVIVDLIGQATEHILLVGYAVHNEPSVLAALKAARVRGVTVTLVLERSTDNPKYTSQSTPFPGLDATRLCWPLGVRPAGASLHAKLLVIDSRSALVGSANITGAAFTNNLECGLLVRGGAIPHQLGEHVALLVAAQHLTPVVG